MPDADPAAEMPEPCLCARCGCKAAAEQTAVNLELLAEARDLAAQLSRAAHLLAIREMGLRLAEAEREDAQADQPDAAAAPSAGRSSGRSASGRAAPRPASDDPVLRFTRANRALTQTIAAMTRIDVALRRTALAEARAETRPRAAGAARKPADPQAARREKLREVVEQAIMAGAEPAAQAGLIERLGQRLYGADTEEELSRGDAVGYIVTGLCHEFGIPNNIENWPHEVLRESMAMAKARGEDKDTPPPVVKKLPTGFVGGPDSDVPAAFYVYGGSFDRDDTAPPAGDDAAEAPPPDVPSGPDPPVVVPPVVATPPPAVPPVVVPPAAMSQSVLARQMRHFGGHMGR
jgi:hypothetical protein